MDDVIRAHGGIGGRSGGSIRRWLVRSCRAEQEARFRELMQAHIILARCRRSARRCGMARTSTASGSRWRCFRRSVEVPGARRLGRLGLPLPVWAPASGLEQHPVAALAGAAASQSRVAGAGVVRTAIVRTGRPVSATRWCCWRPLSTPPGSMARSTVPRTGPWSDMTRGFRRRPVADMTIDAEEGVSLPPDPACAPAIVRRRLDPTLHKGVPRTMLSAAQMRSTSRFLQRHR